MKILVIGSGSREHAIVWKLNQSPHKPEIICVPGNAGISKIAECIDIDVSNIKDLVEFASSNSIDLTVVGPELPLSLGIVDEFEKAGLRIFGPNRKAAILESSKMYAKRFMRVNDIPTSYFSSFSEFDRALKFISVRQGKYVIKADGLAAGKGVYVCSNKAEGENALKEIMIDKKFGDSGNNVIIEEFKNGFEVTMMVLMDGNTIATMPPSMDYKKSYDGEDAPNTGGLGAICPHPLMTQELYEKIMEKVVMPTAYGLQERDIIYKGVLYIGLMIDNGDPYVLEYNVRFGDPETETTLMLLDSDLVQILNSCIDGTLKNASIKWLNETSICVVAASEGYPGDYETGLEITGLDDLNSSFVEVFHGGTRISEDKTLTSGGRVLSVTARGATDKLAVVLAYDSMSKLNFTGINFRKDIGILKIGE